MRHSLIAIVAASSVATLAFAPTAHAGRTPRADIKCPYGDGGLQWNPSAGNPLAISTGVTGAYNGLFVPANPASISFDDAGLNVTSASQYNTYAAVPDPSACTGSNPIAPEPLAQVMNYTLGAGNAFGAAGDIEVEFNYNVGVTSGLASFTLAGVTFTANGLSRFSAGTDLLFSSTGAFKGAISDDGGSLSSALPATWKASSGGGGTVSAPELDASTGAAALALLFAGIAVLRGRRRA